MAGCVRDDCCDIVMSLKNAYQLRFTLLRSEQGALSSNLDKTVKLLRRNYTISLNTGLAFQTFMTHLVVSETFYALVTMLSESYIDRSIASTPRFEHAKHR